MTKKRVRLNLDDLRVESFLTTPATVVRGESVDSWDCMTESCGATAIDTTCAPGCAPCTNGPCTDGTTDCAPSDCAPQGAHTFCGFNQCVG